MAGAAKYGWSFLLVRQARTDYSVNYLKINSSAFWLEIRIEY